jgi:pimeloyl-ACP methyl ester carboxylesterase
MSVIQTSVAMKTEIAHSVQPFSISIPDGVLTDLQRRLSNTRWMNPIKPTGWEHGIDPGYLNEFISYWRDTFDWRAQEEKLNSFHHFTAGVEDYDLHFLHEKAKDKAGIPILLLHGWPDSFYRFNKIIPMIIDPLSAGLPSELAFDVVVPSLPGFGFTQSPSEVKLNQPMRHSASLLFQLMTDVLGYSRFVIAGGDGGSPLAQAMAIDYPEVVKAIYITDPGWHTQGVDVSTLSKKEKKYAEKGKQQFMEQGAYAMVQTTKPQSLAYALNDSPAALASWILDRFYFWCDGDIEKSFSKDELLTNIMIYWSTQTIGSSMRAYKMEALSPTLSPKDYVNTATGLGLFPKDIGGIPPREFVERTVNVQHWTEFERGGHFTAWEEPELMAADLLKFFSTIKF